MCPGYPLRCLLSQVRLQQEVTQAATEAQLTIEQQRADILQASVNSSRVHEARKKPGAVVTIKQARAAAAEATRLAESLKNEVQCPLLFC